MSSIEGISAVDGLPTPNGVMGSLGDPVKAPADSESKSAEKIRTDFLNLLSTQLSNQNPLEPMDNHDLTLQLSALAQLEQLQLVGSNFENMLSMFGLSSCAGMIGQKVAFYPTNSDGSKATEAVMGEVMQAKVVDGEAKMVVRVGDATGETMHEISMSEVVGVMGGYDQTGTKLDAALQRMDADQRQIFESIIENRGLTRSQCDLILENIDTLPSGATQETFYGWLNDFQAKADLIFEQVLTRLQPAHRNALEQYVLQHELSNEEIQTIMNSTGGLPYGNETGADGQNYDYTTNDFIEWLEAFDTEAQPFIE